MTVGEALARATRAIAPFDARVLLEEACGLASARLFAHPETELEAAALERFETMTARRACGEPVAYITGSAGFYGRTFRVDRRVLVPRPETEHVVEAVLDFVRGASGRVRIVDVGTGSGAIAITLAAEDERVDALAIDVSAEALEVARENARLLGVADRVRCIEGDLLAPLRAGPAAGVVVANLPYIPTAAIPSVPDPVGFEPRIALDGGPDGLGPYRRLLDEAGGLVAPGGALFLEAAPGTIDALAELAEAFYPRAGIEVGSDYAGLDRYVAILL